MCLCYIPADLFVGGMMKVLLITNYWYPWNTSGTMRWLQMGRYLDFDVLTSRKPRKGFYDETLPFGHFRRVYRHGSGLPAVLSGLYLALRAIFFRSYDVYIFTVPPFTLAFGAYILQLLGRRVVIDIRDNGDNKNNHWKLITKICQYFQERVKHRTTVMQFMDEGATRILSGYNEELNTIYRVKPDKWRFIDKKSRSYYWFYNRNIRHGQIPDYRKRINGVYNCSSYQNLLYLGFKGLPTDCIHPECVRQPVQSWKESAKQMKEYLDAI